MNRKTKKKFIRTISTKCSWLLILLLGRVGRYKVLNKHYLFSAEQNNKPYIVITWHGRMLLPIYVLKNRALIAMVSEHGDGEIIAKTIERLGYKTIRGSSTRGGSKAFRNMMRALRKGHPCTILPDGPQGPRQYMKLGAIRLAQRTNALLLPLTFSAKKPITINSWDRFTLWWPFSKLYAVFGEPVQIPKNTTRSELEQYREHIEKRMNKLVEEADALFQ